MVGSIVILNLALWLLYRNTRNDLEAELGRRLENVAQVLASTLDPQELWEVSLLHTEYASKDSLEAFAFDAQVLPLRNRLFEVFETTNLANLTLFDTNGHPFLDMLLLGTGEILHDPLDRTELRAALAGATVHTPLYRSGNEYLATGYAPVPDDFGQYFAVGVEADALFFGGLLQLRQSLFAAGALSVALLVALGALLGRMQSRLARAEAAVQRAETLAAMGRMAAGISHEIRNPLGIIQATASRLKKRYDDPESPDEKFGFIADEVERLNGILTGYLSFARDEPPNLQPMDLVAVVQRTLRMIRPELEEPRVTLEVDLPESCMVRGDAQRFQQLAMNLVLNSVQAMPDGGHLRVQMRPENSSVELVFSDTGPGIPRSVRDRVFEPFYTTKEKGSGLGLAVVRRIVEQHGGSITLGDSEGGGARIGIRLPRG
ncbi:MAG: PAS domain-containing sensor histidine kinase [Candidatus Krumholzibacteriia bacterium]